MSEEGDPPPTPPTEPARSGDTPDRSAALRDIIQHRVRRFREEQANVKAENKGGSLERLIGGIEYHAGNIAFITISGLLLILFISVCGLLGIDKNPEKLDAIKSIILAILGLTGTILGYIFGRSGAKGPDK